MKKILCMLTALPCVFSIVACDLSGGTNGDEIGNPLEQVVAASNPTEVVTQVIYSFPSSNPLSEYNGKLNGYYKLEIDGSDSIFEYNFGTLATPEDMEPDGIVEYNGVFYCKDGKSSFNGDEWEVISADKVDAKLNLVKSRFKTYEKSADEKKLTATITGANIESIIGHTISADGDISFVLKTNGIYLTGITISYKSTTGADVTIDTSYTYNEINLDDKFPTE